jgi:F-type H+-transporting ATPase subunit b
MEDILQKIGLYFVLSLPTVVFVFLLLLVLERIFFRRLEEVRQAREAATRGALKRARQETVEAEEKWREYEAAFQAARQEVYRLREADRREALRERDDALKKWREEAEAWLRDAQMDLAAEVESAQRELEQSTRALATQIADAVLAPTGGAASPGGRS